MNNKDKQKRFKKYKSVDEVAKDMEKRFKRYKSVLTPASSQLERRGTANECIRELGITDIPVGRINA